MAESSLVVAQGAELSAALRAAAAGAPKPVYLFVGEPFQTAAAAHALVDALVPAARRSFNAEIWDGRTTPILPIIDSVRTPGFFAGTKVVWLRETTLFLSGEKRADLTAALFSAWDDGRQGEAAEKLLTLVALAGLSQQQFRDTRWSALTKTRIREVFGEELDTQKLAQLDALQAVCLARDLGVSAYRDDSGALLEFLKDGVLPGAVLVLTASAVDARKRLYKRVREIGMVIDLTPDRERSGSLSPAAVDDVVRQAVRDFDKRLTPEARHLIVRRAGTDVTLLASELEKLCLYVGDRPSITEADVRVAFRDMAESWIFDFTGALATGQVAQAVPLLRGLLEQGEPPLRLLAMIARELRFLLVARECLDDILRGIWRPDLSFKVFQSRVLPQLDVEILAACGNAHPFVLYRRFQDAARVDGRLLRAALVNVSDLDLRLKSSRGDAAMLLEAFVIEWCLGRRLRASLSARATGRPGGGAPGARPFRP
jgi:DNA polymerase-3 subunit delta